MLSILFIVMAFMHHFCMFILMHMDFSVALERNMVVNESMMLKLPVPVFTNMGAV